MITKKTKQVAIVSSVLLVSIIVAVGLAVRMIILESVVLSDQVAAIAIDQSQQAMFVRLQKLEQETEGDRMQLRSYFLESQSDDSIDFLNYIEQAAEDRGLTIETINPTEVERADQKYLSVGYDISGSLTQVERFIELLETIPYVSQVMSVQLNQKSSMSWQANVMIDVAILTYEPII